MSKFFSNKTLGTLVALTISGGMLFASGAFAESHEHDMHRGHFDNRYNHGHYYPEFGYRLDILPPGYLSLGFGGRRFFFFSGVWYTPTSLGYVVARPPIGIVTPELPPDYSTVMIGSAPYYYANETYYTASQGGFLVVNPPAENTYIQAPSPQILAPQATQSLTPKPPSGMWYFCASANTYYPDIATCKEGWKTVPAVAPAPL